MVHFLVVGERFSPLCSPVAFLFRRYDVVGKQWIMVHGISIIFLDFALVVEIGHLPGQRLPLLRKILCADDSNQSQKQLKRKALRWSGENLDEKEVLVFDAGAHISELNSASIKRYVIRLAANCTARQFSYFTISDGYIIFTPFKRQFNY